MKVKLYSELWTERLTAINEACEKNLITKIYVNEDPVTRDISLVLSTEGGAQRWQFISGKRLGPMDYIFPMGGNTLRVVIEAVEVLDGQEL